MRFLPEWRRRLVCAATGFAFLLILTAATASDAAAATITSDASSSAVAPLTTLSALFNSANIFENPLSDTAAVPIPGNDNVLPLQAGSPPEFVGVTNPPYQTQGTVEQNYVAYGIYGVSWGHFRKMGITHSPSYSIGNLTMAQLTAIWTGTLSCTIGMTNYTMNWVCLGGTTAPIDCYVATPGSATEETWKVDVSGSDTPACLNNEAIGTANTHIVAENQVSSITTQGDEQDAIFFFSTLEYANFVPGKRLSRQWRVEDEARKYQRDRADQTEYPRDQWRARAISGNWPILQRVQQLLVLDPSDAGDSQLRQRVRVSV